MKYSRIISKCQFSKKKDLKRILSLGFLPAVNRMQKVNSKKNYEYFFPTNLVYSPSSKLFQIDNIVDKKDLSILAHLFIDHGRKICIANRPKCQDCIIKPFCPSSLR